MDQAPTPPSFDVLFAQATTVVRDEAHIAAEGIPHGVDPLVVQRILADVQHRERNLRLLVAARQDDGLQQAAAGAVKYLKRVVRYFDPNFCPQEFHAALEYLQMITSPIIAPAPKRRPAMPHYTAALQALRALGVGSDEARAMLRGVGFRTRMPS